MKSPDPLSTIVHGQRVATCLLAVFFLSGCGLIQGMQEPPEEEEPEDNQPNDQNQKEKNDCGGDEELTFEGEVAERGDRCGPCDRDTLQCDESDEEGNTLVCEPGGTLCRGPENVQATTDLVDEVVVSWDHIEDADEYVVYRDGTEIATEPADGHTPGDELSITDDEASPATPEAPANFQASEGDNTDGIELTWEFDEETMLPDGEEHTYEVVAVYDEFEHGDSEPVAVTGHTVGEFNDDYEFRRDEGEWIGISNPPCVNDQCQHSDDVDDDGGGPNLPEITDAEVSATDKAVAYEITIEVEDIEFVATATEYQLRALSDTGVSGEAADAQGHLDIRDVYAQFERADDDDGDAQDFEPVGEFQHRAVEFDDDEEYRPVEPVVYKDMPHDEEPYHYRVTLWPDDYEGQSLTTDSSVGQRGSPRLFSTSNDDTLRSIYPSGTEAWSEGSIQGYVFLATDPDGNIYATGEESKTSVSKFDSEGNEQWEFDEPDDTVNYVAASNHGFVYATSENRIYRIAEDDETEFDYWEDDDGRTGRGVVADADGYVYVALHDDENEEYAIQKLIFPDDLGDDVDVEWNVDTVKPTMVIAGGNGYLYWGTTETSVKRVEVDSQTPQDDVETIEFNWTMEVLGLAITPEERLYVAGFDPPPSTFLGSYIKWIDPSFENFSDVIPSQQVEDLAVNQISVDPMGNVYFGTSASFGAPNDREERIFKLDDSHEEVWVFEGHFANDSSVFHDVYDIIVTPGFYGTFPEAWEEIQDQLD